MTLISKIYDVKDNPLLRGQAKNGFIRPTIKQFFTSADWFPILSWLRLKIGDMYNTGLSPYLQITGLPKIAVLSPTKICLNYLLTTTNRAVIVDIVNDSFSMGSYVEVGSSTTNGYMHTDVTTIDSNRVIYTYKHNNNPFTGRLRIGTISGTTISLGSEQVYTTYTANGASVTKLNGDNFLFVYTDSGGLKARVGTVVTNTVSFSNVYDISSLATEHNKVTKINDTTVLVSFYNSEDYLGQSIILKINGTVITHGNSYTFYNNHILNNSSLGSCLISENTVCIVYATHSTNILSYIIATVNDTEITFSGPYSLSDYADYLTVNIIDTDKIAIIYRARISGVYSLRSIVGEIKDESTITFDDAFEISAISGITGSTKALTSNKLITNTYLDNRLRLFLSTIT